MRISEEQMKTSNKYQDYFYGLCDRYGNIAGSLPEDVDFSQMKEATVSCPGKGFEAGLALVKGCLDDCQYTIDIIEQFEAVHEEKGELTVEEMKDYGFMLQEISNPLNYINWLLSRMEFICTRYLGIDLGIE